MNPTLPLDAFDLALATSLVLVAGVVSLLLQLRLERRLLWASLRTVTQLLLVGYLLEGIFAIESALAVSAVLLLMIAAASRAAVQRSSRGFSGVTWRAFITLLLAGLITTLTVTELIIDVEPWYRPRYLIPLLGMVLGNALTGISLCLDQVLERLVERRATVEMELALGASRWEAARDVLGAAVTRGMIPILNSMLVVGVVSLPGMMTGQILAGADPIVAVKYQIVVMFMLSAATSLGCIIMALLVYQRLFNERHQLEVERIVRR